MSSPLWLVKFGFEVLHDEGKMKSPLMDQASLSLVTPVSHSTLSYCSGSPATDGTGRWLSGFLIVPFNRLTVSHQTNFLPLVVRLAAKQMGPRFVFGGDLEMLHRCSKANDRSVKCCECCLGISQSVLQSPEVTVAFPCSIPPIIR